MALPQDHPERLAASREPAFDAWVRMHTTFADSQNAPLPPSEMAGPRAELSSRLERDLGLRRLGVAPADRAGVRGNHQRTGWGGLFVAWFSTPAGRVTLGFAAFAIVMGATLWMTHRPSGEESMIRGDDRSAGAPVLTAPVAHHGALELKWSAAPGADAYRLVLYAADLSELAKLEPTSATSVTLRAGALPAGLPSGSRVVAEVVALRGGDPISRSKLRPITLP
jgi:hypothetical protein